MTSTADDAARRREIQRENELQRLGTRTEGDLTRTEGDLTRTEGDLTRTEWDLTRDGGGQSQRAADIFQRAASLGGHLVVAFVAPVAPSTLRSQFDGNRASRLQDDVIAARAALRQMIDDAVKRAAKRPKS